MICFVILHYIVIDETIQCVEKVKKLMGDKKIIIVDNCSPDGSGKELFDIFKSDPEVDVILNDSNLGFANGNNIGCQYAKNTYDPQFYVVMNNDVEITQNDFIQRIKSIWDKEKFHVLSPDIYSTTKRVHQSPKSIVRTNLIESKKLQYKYYRKMNSTFLVPLRCYLKKIWFINNFYFRSKNINLGIDYTKKYYNVPMHGSCFVFSKIYIHARKEAFYPNTFLYYESEILDYECLLNGWKELYDPSIKVLHHQNVSTNATYKNELMKVRFMNEQNYKSITAFINEYGKEE